MNGGRSEYGAFCRKVCLILGFPALAAPAVFTTATAKYVTHHMSAVQIYISATGLVYGGVANLF